MPAPLLKMIIGNQAERGLSGIIVGIFVLVCIVFIDSPVVDGRTRLGGELLPWHITANTIIMVHKFRNLLFIFTSLMLINIRIDQ